MATEQPITRITQELDRVLDMLNTDLDRLEIVAGALAGLSRPVPDYEPWFHHVREPALPRFELGDREGWRQD